MYSFIQNSFFIIFFMRNVFFVQSLISYTILVIFCLNYNKFELWYIWIKKIKF